MDIFEQLAHIARNGIAVLRACAARSPHDVASVLGLPLSQAREWERLAEVYFGPADSPRRQERAIAAAEAAGHSLERLRIIERHARKLRKRGQAWALREELCALAGTVDEVNAHGALRVRELGAESTPRAGVRFSRVRGGMRTLTVCGDQHVITALEKALDTRVPDGTTAPRTQALAAAFWDHVAGDGGVVKPTYRTVIAVGLDDACTILRGDGDDVILGCSDGTTMTGAQWLDTLDGEIYAGLFHPTAGPVNLYKARCANWKQRVLARAENLVCPWPDCQVPSDRCEAHHIEAHVYGGDTTPANLTMLCKYHNGVNDDNPNAPPNRGRIHRVDGKVYYRSPGGRWLRNTHDNTALGAMELV